MSTQIRLAKEQGLLVGKHLSVLQVNAIYFHEVEKQSLQRDRDQQQFKYALLSTGNVPFADLFPEIMAQIESQEDQDVDPSSESGQVVYRFADLPELTPEEMQASLDELLASADEDLTVNGGDIYG